MKIDENSSFPCIAFERRDSILLCRLHTRGGELLWASGEGQIHAQFGEALRSVARDNTLKVVILTGTGNSFCADREEPRAAYSAARWHRIMREGRDMLINMLDIDVPVISA